MSGLSVILTVLIVIASIVLILVVLVQKSKGSGLSSNFSSSNAIMGVRKTTDFIEKATWGLAAFVLVLSIACVMISPRVGRTVATDSVPQAPAATQSTPTFPTSGGFPEEQVPANDAATTPAPVEQAPQN